MPTAFRPTKVLFLSLCLCFIVCGLKVSLVCGKAFLVSGPQVSLVCLFPGVQIDVSCRELSVC